MATKFGRQTLGQNLECYGIDKIGQECHWFLITFLALNEELKSALHGALGMIKLEMSLKA